MNKTIFNNTIIPLTDSLYRMAKSILQDSDEARDVVQDQMLKLWEMHTKLSSVDNLRAYVFRSVRNRCLDILRLRKDEGELDEMRLDKSLNPYEQTEMNDAIHRIHQLIELLPEMQRTIIRMRDVEEMEINEIAQIMEISENSVSTNLSRARKKIRETMLKDFNK
jgi:RNA polymerase sigma-70 factor (ECF subfamily)